MAGPWEQFTQSAEGSPAGPWTQFGGEALAKPVEKSVPSPDRYTIKGMQREAMTTPPTRAQQNVAAAVDMAISFPGMVVGQAMGAASGLEATLAGKGHEEAQKVRKEATQAFVEANPLNNPIHKMMVAAGHTEGYDKSDVSELFDKISGGISKGGEWIERKTNGVIGKGDFEDLVNSAVNLAVPEAAKLAGKAVGKMGEGKPAIKPPVDEPILRPDPSPLAPPKADATPLTLAKQHIEETVGIKTPAEQKALNAQRRADAKAAFAEDPLYADYLKNYAEGELQKTTAANELAADKIEAADVAKGPKQLPTEKLWAAKDRDRTIDPSSTNLNELKADIQRNGIQEPITITVSKSDGKGYVTDGNNRLAAAKDLGIKDIPYRVVTTNVPFTKEQLAKARSVEELGVPKEELAPKTKSAEALAAESWLQEQIKEQEIKPALNIYAEHPQLEGTKITSPSGKPQVVYHGTTKAFKQFSLKKSGAATGVGDLGEGFYFADHPEAVSQYTAGEGGNIRPVYLDIKKPATEKVLNSPKIQNALDDDMGFNSVRDILMKDGYDGIIKTHKDGTREIVAFRPSQVIPALGSKLFAGPEGGVIEQILKTPGTKRTPEQILQLRKFRKEGGAIDPKLLGKMAAVGLGAAAGLYLDPDHPVEGAVLGSVAGFFGGRAIATPIKAGKAIAEVFKTDKRLRMNEIADTHEISIEKAARAIWQKQAAIYEKVPDQARREAITNWMQGDKSIPLNKAEYEAALKAKDFFAELGEAGIESGVLTHLLPDYVTNLWDLEGTNKAAWAKLTSGPGMSESSRFNMQRKIASIAEGKKLGLKPVTEDITTIMGIYGNSLSRTMANRQLMESLRNTPVPGGAGQMLMPAPVAPSNYVPINHPQLRGQLVHPDLKGSMEFLFQQKTPSGIMAGIEAVNTGLKRLAVSASLFHAKALTDAFIGAGGNPLKITGMVAGSNKFLKMVREGGAGDIVDKAAEGGLKYTLDKGALADEDLGGSFYKGMDMLKNAVDEVIPGAGRLVQGATELNHAVDTIMWSRLHAGMKLEIFASTYEKLLKNNAEANAKNPAIPLKTSKEISSIAASYANDLFGGLNWRRAAEESRTKLGRDFTQAAYAPQGRRALQILLFAPDWTLSTTRAAAKAFGVGTGVKGLVKPQELADLHRQYVLRSAVYYFTVANALNYALSGHGVMDNKDPTTVDMGDGRTMQFSKHSMEPVHWVTKPGQQALNKLGFFPSEAIEQAAGVEYLSTGGHAPKIEPTLTAHARHLLKRAVPIAASQADTGMAAGVSGALGFPIYGKTDEERKAAREEAKRKKIKKKDAAYEASRN